MSWKLWTVALLASVASSPLAQGFDLTVDSGASGFEGTMDWRMAMRGWIVGDHSPADNPDGTRTLSKSIQKGKAVPAKIGAQALLNLRSSGKTAIGGAFRLEFVDGSVYVNDLQLDSLQAGSMGIEGKLIVRHRAFQTLQPSADHPAGSIGMPLGDALHTWTFSQTAPSKPRSVMPTFPGRWRLAIDVPGTLSLGLPVLGEEPLVVCGVTYTLRGELRTDSGQASFVGGSTTVDQWAGPIAEELPEICLPETSLNLWLDLGLAHGTVRGRTVLKAATEPAD
jgi:hypothetical protein